MIPEYITSVIVLFLTTRLDGDSAHIPSLPPLIVSPSRVTLLAFTVIAFVEVPDTDILAPIIVSALSIITGPVKEHPLKSSVLPIAAVFIAICKLVGQLVGLGLGVAVGTGVGLGVGVITGVGLTVGVGVGNGVGLGVGLAVGLGVGEGLGLIWHLGCVGFFSQKVCNPLEGAAIIDGLIKAPTNIIDANKAKAFFLIT